MSAPTAQVRGEGESEGGGEVEGGVPLHTGEAAAPLQATPHPQQHMQGPFPSHPPMPQPHHQAFHPHMPPPQWEGHPGHPGVYPPGYLHPSHPGPHPHQRGDMPPPHLFHSNPSYGPIRPNHGPPHMQHGFPYPPMQYGPPAGFMEHHGPYGPPMHHPPPPQGRRSYGIMPPPPQMHPHAFHPHPHAYPNQGPSPPQHASPPFVTSPTEGKPEGGPTNGAPTAQSPLSPPPHGFSPGGHMVPPHPAPMAMPLPMPAPAPHHSNGPSDPAYGEALYKTEYCRSFSETGYCRYGLKCRFAHGMSDLRVVVRHRKYKTERCNNFARDGVCPYGPRCRFIHNTITHDQDELPGLGAVHVAQVRGLVGPAPPGMAPAAAVLPHAAAAAAAPYLAAVEDTTNAPSSAAAVHSAPLAPVPAAGGPKGGFKARSTNFRSGAPNPTSSTSPPPPPASAQQPPQQHQQHSQQPQPQQQRNRPRGSNGPASFAAAVAAYPSSQPQSQPQQTTAFPPNHYPNIHLSQQSSPPHANTAVLASPLSPDGDEMFPPLQSPPPPQPQPPQQQSLSHADDPVATLFHRNSVSRSPVIGPSAPTGGTGSPFFAGASAGGLLGVLPGLSPSGGATGSILGGLPGLSLGQSGTGSPVLAAQQAADEGRPRSLSSGLRAQDDPRADALKQPHSTSPPIGPSRHLTTAAAGASSVMHVLQLPTAASSAAAAIASSATGEGDAEVQQVDGESSLFSSPIMISSSPSLLAVSGEQSVAAAASKLELLSLGPGAFVASQ